MSELSRRGFIGSAAAAASLVGLNAAADEDFPFKNNVPDPLLSGKELPTFKFELEKSQGEVIGRATARKRPSSSCRSPRGSPASRCSSSRVPCASCTGTPPPPSGRS